MRLRTTAPPNAFLMLKPKRFRASSLERTKTVKWLLERRFPARYTRSKSPRRTRRASRGNVKPCAGWPPLLGREPMTSLLATSRKDFAAALGLHARTKPVSFSAASSPRLKSTLWQDTPPCFSMRPWKIPCAIPRAARKAGRTHVPRWLRDSLRQANCRNTGSFRNLLVYLSCARRVKKRAG
jgi:hypothetical protein